MDTARDLASRLASLLRREPGAIAPREVLSQRVVVTAVARPAAAFGCLLRLGAEEGRYSAQAPVRSRSSIRKARTDGPGCSAGAAVRSRAEQ